MTATELLDVHLASAGEVTRHTYARQGYQRLARGMYGHAPVVEGLDAYQRRRAEFVARTRAVLACYQARGAVPFGVTAFQVLGVALPEALEDWETCHILLPPGGGKVARAGVVGHRGRFPARVWGRRAGLPLLHPVEHWMQLRGASDDALIEVGDGLVRRRQPVLSLDDLTAAVVRLAGRPGAARVGRALRWVRPGTDSLYETRTRLVLVHAGLPEPAVNRPVRCAGSGVPFNLDMAYAAERIGVEYDGAVHVGDRDQMEFDARRRRLLQDDGWLLITVTAAQLRASAQVVASVEQALVLRRAMLARAW